jgi:hypothetical protein
LGILLRQIKQTGQAFDALFRFGSASESIGVNLGLLGDGPLSLLVDQKTKRNGMGVV